MRQFVVGFQGGYDGYAPNRQTKKYDEISDTNTQGWNVGSIGTGVRGGLTDYGSQKYKHFTLQSIIQKFHGQVRPRVHLAALGIIIRNAINRKIQKYLHFFFFLCLLL